VLLLLIIVASFTKKFNPRCVCLIVSYRVNPNCVLSVQVRLVAAAGQDEGAAIDPEVKFIAIPLESVLLLLIIVASFIQKGEPEVYMSNRVL